MGTGAEGVGFRVHGSHGFCDASGFRRSLTRSEYCPVQSSGGRFTVHYVPAPCHSSYSPESTGIDFGQKHNTK